MDKEDYTIYTVKVKEKKSITGWDSDRLEYETKLSDKDIQNYRRRGYEVTILSKGYRK